MRHLLLVAPVLITAIPPASAQAHATSASTGPRFVVAAATPPHHPSFPGVPWVTNAGVSGCEFARRSELLKNL